MRKGARVRGGRSGAFLFSVVSALLFSAHADVARYTVHEKAQNFTVPIPLTTSWATEQIDELFTSLLGGAGLAGAGAERDDQGVMGAVDGGADDGLGGLRVF